MASRVVSGCSGAERKSGEEEDNCQRLRQAQHATAPHAPQCAEPAHISASTSPPAAARGRQPPRVSVPGAVRTVMVDGWVRLFELPAVQCHYGSHAHFTLCAASLVDPRRHRVCLFYALPAHTFRAASAAYISHSLHERIRQAACKSDEGSGEVRFAHKRPHFETHSSLPASRHQLRGPVVPTAAAAACNLQRSHHSFLSAATPPPSAEATARSTGHSPVWRSTTQRSNTTAEALSLVCSSPLCSRLVVDLLISLQRVSNACTHRHIELHGYPASAEHH